MLAKPALLGMAMAFALAAFHPVAAAEPEPLVVFAAASLTEAFTDLGAEFERWPGGRPVAFNFGSSNTLRVQLEQGARADLFATANQVEMDRAAAARLIVAPPVVFARNQLAVMVPRGSDLAGYQDLARPGLKVVLAHKEVPVGGFALQFLEAADKVNGSSSGYMARVLANVVSFETTVKQVVAKVRLGEADAGVVYSTDATPANSGAIRLLAIPDRMNITTSLPAAVVAGAAHPEAAGAFVKFLVSPAGQACLLRRGFREPPR